MIIIKRFIKIFIVLAANTISILFKLNLSKKKIIIFQCYDENRYCDNTRYLFENLSKSNLYEVYWTTENLEIKKYLNKKNLKFLSLKSNFIKYIYYFSNAILIVNPGTNYFDYFNILSNKVIKVSTSHGMGPKLTITKTDNFYNSKKEISEINKFNYVNFTADFVAINSGVNIFNIPQDKIIKLGFPRCDNFFNKDLMEQKYLNKNICKKLLNNKNIKHSKIIYYTPTWRPYDYDFPLNNMKNFDYAKFDSFLIKFNIYFFYTLHSERKFINIPKNLTRIIKIDTKKFPLFDSNEFMTETDILINDYSTTTTDYCILKKPQIFFMPDYSYYNEVKGFIEDYRAVMPGKEVLDYDHLTNNILDLIQNPNEYKIQFEDKIIAYLKNYYDTNLKNSSEEFRNFFNKIFL